MRLVGVQGNVVLVRGLDCLDGTPLLDLKPDRTLFTPIAPPQAGDFQIFDQGKEQAIRYFSRERSQPVVSIEAKKKFYKRIADEIHERTGVRKEDVWINLVDDAGEDWSFGNGEMQ